MFEEAVDIFLGARVGENNVGVPLVLGLRMVDLIYGLVVEQRPYRMFRAGNQRFRITPHFQRAVINADTQAAFFCSGNEVLDRNLPETCHIWLIVLAGYRKESVGTDHVISVWLQFLRNPFEIRLPFRQRYVAGFPDISVKFVCTFIYAPI